MKVKVDKTLVASITLHVLVLGWGLVTFSSKAYIAPEESLPVDIISTDQLAQMMSGQKTGDKKQPKPKVEKIAEAKPEEDSVGKVTEKKELIKTNSQPDPPPKPVEQKVAAVQPQQQPKPKERSFDPAQIQRDLDKRAATRHEQTGSALNASASLGTATGTAATNIATWRGAFMTAVRRCFNPTYNGQDQDQYAADIDIPMKIDGTLASEPIIVEVRGPSRTIAQAIAESAKRAIVQCQAYAFLPKQQYESWKKIETTFTLRDAL